jgi:hypothetical protein
MKSMFSDWQSWLMVIAGGLLGLIVGLAIAAYCLRRTAQWLGFGMISYRLACKSAFIANFTGSMLQFIIVMNYLLLQRTQRTDRMDTVNFAFVFQPTILFYWLLTTLVVSAYIFIRLIPGENGTRLTFSDAFALAAFNIAVSSAAWFIVGVIAVLGAAAIGNLFF